MGRYSCQGHPLINIVVPIGYGELIVHRVHTLAVPVDVVLHVLYCAHLEYHELLHAALQRTLALLLRLREIVGEFGQFSEVPLHSPIVVIDELHQLSLLALQVELQLLLYVFGAEAAVLGQLAIAAKILPTLEL